MIKIALTGHRPERLNLPHDINDKSWMNITMFVQSVILSHVHLGQQIHIYCGMAEGCDILWGYTAAKLKENGADIKIHCVLPCKDYNYSNGYYNFIKEYADEWIELSDEFYKGCDNARDQYMIDNCDVLLAVWDGNKSGGVWSTIRKAQKADKKVKYFIS